MEIKGIPIRHNYVRRLERCLIERQHTFNINCVEQTIYNVGKSPIVSTIYLLRIVGWNKVEMEAMYRAFREEQKEVV